MKKLITLSAIAFSILLLTTTTQANEEVHAKNWGYMGNIGPRNWSEVKKEFNMCSEGKQQSPINVVASKDTDLKPLDINYASGSSTIVNNGHTIQVNIADGSVLKIDGDKYKLRQFHFHVPSENNINGEAYPLEAHFVHATDDGKLAVIAVMFEEGAENPILTKAWQKIPSLKVVEEVKCSLSADEVKSLMPNNKDYYKFMGSLTTPPCSENVKWHVYKNALTASRKQINTFFNTFSFPNNRPIQSTNGRVIEE